MDSFQASGVPRLEVPASEDPMQMSPDLDRHLSVDEDIDIDLDIDAEPPLEDEDDDMDGQNGSNTGYQQYSDRQGGVANDDDMMDGDEGVGRLDGHTSLLDEDLDDADNQISGNLLDNGFETTHDHDRQGEPPSREPPEPRNTNLEDIDSLDNVPVAKEGSTDEALHVFEVGQVENTSEGTGNVAARAAKSHALQGSDIPWELSDDLDQENIAYEDDLDELVGDTINHAHPQPMAVVADQSAVTGGPASKYPDDIASAKLGHDDGLPQDPQINEEPLPPFPDVHPITVNYQGNEMSLFPSLDEDSEQSQTYLLKHPSVVSDRICSLLQQCRSVLADSIGDDDELDISFVDLGLSIDESAADSLETTLEHILEIYLHLSHNDGLENPDPLYIELCIKTRCSSRLDYLLNAVAEDKGLSELDFPHGSEGVDEESGSTYEAEEADGRPCTNEEEAVALEAGAIIHSIGEAPLASADRISDECPNTPRMATAMSEGRDRHPSKIDGKLPVDITPNPASVLVAEFNANGTEGDGGPETQNDNIGPPEIVTGKTNDEAAAEGSVIDYSEDEFFHEESSAGSSTLQGDIIDTRVSVVKAPALRTDIPDVDDAENQEQLTDDLIDLEKSQQPLEAQGDRAARSHIHDSLQSLCHVPFDVTKEASEPRVDAKELDVLLDEEDTYDEAEHRDRHKHTQHNTNEQSGTLQDEIRFKLEHSSTDAEILNNTTVNGIMSNREEDIEKIVVVSEQGRTEQTSPSLLGVEFSHTAREDDDIIYDEDEEEQTDPVQNPAPSPPSLKRGRSSLEGGLEASRLSPGISEADSLMLPIADSGTDVKRVRPS